MFADIEVKDGAVSAESVLREMNRGLWSIGYTGQSPERLKLHMQHQDKFDLVTLRAKPGAPAEIAGDVYGLPWPCFGTPEMRHPGTHVLYNTNLHVKDGGGTFRARFGVERNGQTLLAEGSWSKGSEIQDGYPEFTVAVLKRLGWFAELTPPRRRAWSGISARISTAPAGPPTSPAASSAWRWNTAASPTATPRPAPWPGTCPIPSRCTASRSTPPGPTWWRSTRPCRTGGGSACRISASVQARSAVSSRTSPSS